MSIMRHKVLLPTDFSENAWHAINYAIKLYRDEYTDFYILNVFSATGNIMKSLIDMDKGSELYEAKLQESISGLAKTLEKLKLSENTCRKHQFKTISMFNSTLEAIKTLVEKNDIEMIVMGSKGETSSSSAAFGSTAIYVMEKVRSCPVIVIPQKAELKLPKEIVFPTNFKTYFKRRELIHLKNIAKKNDATIIVLHVKEEDQLDESQKECLTLLDDILKDTDYRIHYLSHNSVITSINIFVESRESDMVAFMNRKHTFFGSILTNPLVKEISYHLNVPILAMHDLKN